MTMTLKRILFLASLLASVAIAQDPPPEAEAEAPEPVTISDPAITTQDLKVKLVPLTAEEVEVEANAWRQMVRDTAMLAAEKQLEVRHHEGEDAEKATLQEELDELKLAEGRLLERLGFVLDSWEAKGGDPEAMRNYTIALRGAAVDVEDPSTMIASFRRWLEAEDGAIKWVMKIIIFLVIVTVAWIIAALVGKLVDKALRSHESISKILSHFIGKLVRRILLFIGVLIALSTLGVNVGAMVALIGGGAFIIGLALQDTLSNFANGIMLMIYQPFDVGDAVEVSGVSGSVDSVSLVNTKIRSWDNQIILVPNKSVWGQIITNITGADERRVDMTFGIGYDDDIDKAQAILEKVVSEHELVLEDPAPTIKMHELADSSVNFICRPWAKTADYWAVNWDITKRVKQEFDAAGISIPYPQQDVHFHSAEPLKSDGEKTGKAASGKAANDKVGSGKAPARKVGSVEGTEGEEGVEEEDETTDA